MYITDLVWVLIGYIKLCTRILAEITIDAVFSELVAALVYFPHPKAILNMLTVPFYIH